MKNRLLIIVLFIMSLLLITGCSKNDKNISLSEDSYQLEQKKREKAIRDFYKYIVEEDAEEILEVFSLSFINDYGHTYYENDEILSFLANETISDKLTLVEPISINRLLESSDVGEYMNDLDIQYSEITEFGFNNGNYLVYNVKGKTKDTDEEVSDIIYLKSDLGKYKVTFSYLFFKDYK